LGNVSLVPPTAYPESFAESEKISQTDNKKNFIGTSEKCEEQTHLLAPLHHIVSPADKRYYIDLLNNQYKIILFNITLLFLKSLALI
jgi:hypothetical protein